MVRQERVHILQRRISVLSNCVVFSIALSLHLDHLRPVVVNEPAFSLPPHQNHKILDTGPLLLLPGVTQVDLWLTVPRRMILVAQNSPDLLQLHYHLLRLLMSLLDSISRYPDLFLLLQWRFYAIFL